MNQPPQELHQASDQAPPRATAGRRGGGCRCNANRDSERHCRFGRRPAGEGRSGTQRAVDRHDGWAASVDGVDDLGAVDALQVDRRDAEV
jgi:hypothetical protein